VKRGNWIVFASVTLIACAAMAQSSGQAGQTMSSQSGSSTASAPSTTQGETPPPASGVQEHELPGAMSLPSGTPQATGQNQGTAQNNAAQQNDGHIPLYAIPIGQVKEQSSGSRQKETPGGTSSPDK
jgi:hypothetical protein